MTTAHRVHADLVVALDRLRRAERCAVTLFARVLDEELYRQLGCATIELYASRELSLSESKTRQFLRLARARGRHERERLRRHRGQATLVLDVKPAPAPVEMPTTVSVTMTPVQHARYEKLMERLRKQGRREARADLLLEGLAALTDAGGTREVSSTPCHIVAYRCDTCNTTTVDGRPVASAAARAMACDAVHVSPDRKVRNKATIPPSVRRAVLARDGHRCATPGCGARSFLEVHHIEPRAKGGTNAPENLTTLCGPCHRFAHERART